MNVPSCSRCFAEHPRETLISRVTGECMNREKCNRYLAELTAWVQERNREISIRNLRRIRPIYQGITG